ncbi:MAG: guanine-specific ribonuclease N1 and T1 [Comamonadaceae bacterium CG1_02_60_18]|nr:MAG: guanine-specific ribonuclease N1 and T1 [Comamonadaceae bacterium CG1_02_60_18]PIQ55504.1 MAG: guanine-specific ribonuclease N1 and T1 [Comamonadaceae bacterium CG12_big_fil_rev_8_21_14_0_65_59_15]
MPRCKRFQLFIAGLVFLLAMVGGAQARSVAPDQSQQAIGLSELPREGQQMVALIYQGGPFASERDGVVFGNRERLLPIKKRGYYREYTVATPGLKHRGVRRIVCGGKPRVPDVCYYTADHYQSFRRISP